MGRGMQGVMPLAAGMAMLAGMAWGQVPPVGQRDEADLHEGAGGAAEGAGGGASSAGAIAGPASAPPRHEKHESVMI